MPSHIPKDPKMAIMYLFIRRKPHVDSQRVGVRNLVIRDAKNMKLTLLLNIKRAVLCTATKEP